jgi:hypothetical protein
MHSYLFQKPKKTIINILFVFGLISLIMSVGAIGTIVVWRYSPETVSEISKIIPNFYGNEIQELRNQIKLALNEKEQYEYYKKLYKKLKNISALNIYYKDRQESAQWLIDFYSENNNKIEALNIAQKWRKDYPYDFMGKFSYLDLIVKLDDKVASLYVDELYQKNPDISEVKNRYIQYQLQKGDFNKALEASLTNNVIDLDMKFQIYYRENIKNFSAKQSVKYKINYNGHDQKYSLVLNKMFNNFQGVRVDIDSVTDGTVLSDTQLIINGRYVGIKYTNDLENNKHDGYSVAGQDPYFVFEIPEELQGYSGEVVINFSSKIVNPTKNIVFKEISQNNEWQIFLGTDKGFSENKSKHFTPKYIDDVFVWSGLVTSENSSKVRIDFPSFMGLKIKDFKLRLNNDSIYSKKDITFYHGVINTKEYLQIIGIDPHVIIDMKNSSDLNHMKIQVYLKGEE